MNTRRSNLLAARPPVLPARSSFMTGLFAALFICLPVASGHAALPHTPQQQPQQAQQQQSAAAAPVDIPEGTPVLYHLYGGTTSFSLFGAIGSIMTAKTKNEQKPFYQLIQVDKDTVVSNVVIIPRGSLGEMKVDRIYRKVLLPGFQTGYQVTGLSMTASFVLSAASTRLEFVDSPEILDAKNKNVSRSYEGGAKLVPLSDAEYTGRLKHASIVIDP